jgi:HSF-type DNA-binding
LLLSYTSIYRFFRHGKHSSFQRQLNIYNFRRIKFGLDRDSYYHECFLRDRPELISQIERVEIKGNTSSDRAVNELNSPNFYADATSTTVPPVVVSNATSTVNTGSTDLSSHTTAATINSGSAELTSSVTTLLQELYGGQHNVSTDQLLSQLRATNPSHLSILQALQAGINTNVALSNEGTFLHPLLSDTYYANKASMRNNNSLSLQYQSMIQALRNRNAATANVEQSLQQMISELHARNTAPRTQFETNFLCPQLPPMNILEELRRLQSTTSSTNLLRPSSVQGQPCTTDWYNRQLLIDAVLRNSTSSGFPLNLQQLVNSDPSFQQMPAAYSTTNNDNDEAWTSNDNDRARLP